MEKAKETIIVQGKPWSIVAVCKTYKEASTRLMHLQAENPTFNFKIKRTGPLGTQFSIKKRIDPKLDKIDKEIELKKNSQNSDVNSKKKNKKKR